MIAGIGNSQGSLLRTYSKGNDMAFGARSMSQPTAGSNKMAATLGKQSQPPVDTAKKKAMKMGQRKAIIGTGLASR